MSHHRWIRTPSRSCPSALRICSPSHLGLAAGVLDELVRALVHFEEGGKELVVGRALAVVAAEDLLYFRCFPPT